MRSAVSGVRPGRKRLSRPTHTALTIVGHFGYGASVGALYGAFARRPQISTAIVYGLAVWSISYLGWLPAIGLHQHASKEPQERNFLMVVAHVVWGLTLGLLLRRQNAVRGDDKKNRPRR
jgi:uncharacterized membrane protein YagU involved in acid resistance